MTILIVTHGACPNLIIIYLIQMSSYVVSNTPIFAPVTLFSNLDCFLLIHKICPNLIIFYLIQIISYVVRAILALNLV